MTKPRLESIQVYDIPEIKEDEYTDAQELFDEEERYARRFNDQTD